MPSDAAIRPRQVCFEWTSTPLHWFPGDPMTTHLINVLHLLLPAGERWFVDVYRQALPGISDDRLRADVRGFMGQEAVHARAHSAVLGEWAICCTEVYDEAGADPVMLDLLRWHAAEEVEHRCVAFDAFQALGGRARYPLRVEGMLLAFPVMALLWYRGARFLVRQDPTLPGARYRLREYGRAVRTGRAPGWELLRAVPRYLRPSHHPRYEATPRRAFEYLASSPAALAARQGA